MNRDQEIAAAWDACWEPDIDYLDFTFPDAIEVAQAVHHQVHRTVWHTRSEARGAWGACLFYQLKLTMRGERQAHYDMARLAILDYVLDL